MNRSNDNDSPDIRSPSGKHCFVMKRDSWIVTRILIGWNASHGCPNISGYSGLINAFSLSLNIKENINCDLLLPSTAWIDIGNAVIMMERYCYMQQCVLLLILSNNSLHDRLMLLTRSCDVICFIWSIETYLVGILYDDIHRLLPNESHSFLDGYVLQCRMKNTCANCPKLSVK